MFFVFFFFFSLGFKIFVKERVGKEAHSNLSVCSPDVHKGYPRTGQKSGLGILSKSPMWVPGPHVDEPPWLPPKVCVGRKLELGARASYETQTHQWELGVLTGIKTTKPRAYPMYLHLNALSPHCLMLIVFFFSIKTACDKPQYRAKHWAFCFILSK